MKFLKISSVIITLCVLAGIYASLQYGLVHLNQSFPIPRLGIDLALLIPIILIHPPIQRFIMTVLSRNLNKRLKWVKSQLKQLTEEVKYITHLLRLQRVIVRRISEVIDLQAVSLFSLDTTGEVFQMSDYIGVNTKEKRKFQFKASGGLMVWLKMAQRPLYLPKLTQTERYRYLGREEKEKLKKLQAELCIPLIYANRLNGALFLGPKPKKRQYSREEIAQLFEVATEAAQAIENATTHRNLSTLQRTLSNCQNHLKAVESRFSELMKAHQNLLNYIKMGILVLKSGDEIIHINEDFQKKLAIDVEQRYQEFLTEKAEEIQK